MRCEDQMGRSLALRESSVLEMEECGDGVGAGEETVSDATTPMQNVCAGRAVGAEGVCHGDIVNLEQSVG
jgi:hypothetical protein